MKGYAGLNLIISMLIFGTIGIFRHYIPFSSAFVAMSRGFIGVLFLAAFLLVSRKKISLSAIKNNLLLLLLSGAFIGINWMLLFEAYNHTTVATATLCYYMAPVFVMIASTVFLGEKLTLKKSICIIGAIIGMVLVSGIIETGISSASEISGMIFGLGAAVFYATVILLNKKMKDISSYDMTIVQLFMAAVIVMPYSLLCEDIVFSGVPVYSFIMLALIGILHTGVAYVLYFGSVKNLPSDKVAIYAYIDPIVAIFLSFIILKEEMSVLSAIGAVLIISLTLINDIDLKKMFEKNKPKKI